MDMWASTKTVRIIRLAAVATQLAAVAIAVTPIEPGTCNKKAGKKKPAGKSGLNPIH
jgi:hypothetical protein